MAQRRRGALWQWSIYGGVCGVLGVAACRKPITRDYEYKTQAALYSTPLVHKDKKSEIIAFGSEDGTVHVLTGDGQPLCAYNTLRQVISAPAGGDGAIFFGSTNYTFYAIDTACKELWKYPTRDRIKSDPLYLDGVVYFSSYDGHVYAYAHKARGLLWTYPPLGGASAPSAPKTTTEAGNFSYSSPVTDGERLFVGNLDGQLYAIERKTGALSWKFATQGAISSTPAVSDGTVFFGSNDKFLYAVDAETGQSLRWKFATHDWINGSPLVDEGLVYLGTNDKRFLALYEKTGALKWQQPLKGPVISRPAIYKGLVFVTVGQGDGRVVAFNKRTGEVFWEYQTQYKIESDPVVVGDKLYVTSGDRSLYVFTLRKVPD